MSITLASDQKWIASLNIFRECSDSLLDRIYRDGSMVSFDPSEWVLGPDDQDDSVYWVQYGYFGVGHASSRGKHVLVKIFGAGAMFGELEVLHQCARIEFVEALSPARLLVMPGAIFRKILLRDSLLAQRILMDVSWRFLASCKMEHRLAFANAEQRIAMMMVDLIQVFQKREEDWTFERFITLDFLADACGVTKKSVQRCLEKWTERGWIGRDKGCLVVYRADCIRNLLPNDADSLVFESMHVQMSQHRSLSKDASEARSSLDP